MLPGRNGIEVLSAMRKRGVRIPVLLLTAKDAIEDRVLGLDAGADDYLVKPFAFPEDLHVDRINRTVMRGNRALDLTAKEFELLEYLLENHGQVVSRETLAREIWKAVARHTTLDNVIDVHMARIRRKVDEGYTTKFVTRFGALDSY
jgi:DNA-binding response OmpR family regulator